MPVNSAMYGFRPHAKASLLDARPYKVADGYQANLAGDVDLGVGDVVIMASTGGVVLCPGTEGTEGQPMGVIVGVLSYFDGTFIKKGNVVPGGSTGGGLHERASVVSIVPTSKLIWEVAVDDAVTATTRAAYEAFINENVSFVNTEVGGRAAPQLDISTHAVTAGLGFRIIGISPDLGNRDYSAAGIKLLVTGNDVNEPGFPATKIAGV